MFVNLCIFRFCCGPLFILFVFMCVLMCTCVPLNALQSNQSDLERSLSEALTA